MRRRQTRTLLRLLLAAFVALSGFGPRTAYVHSHITPDEAHHSHSGHDDHADDDHAHHDELPGITDGFAHVHGSWLGIPITLPAQGGEASSESQLAGDSCPTLTAAMKLGPFGPPKERIPWASDLAPPDFRLLSLAARPPRNSFLDGVGTSYALHGRTVVLRC